MQELTEYVSFHAFARSGEGGGRPDYTREGGHQLPVFLTANNYNVILVVRFDQERAAH